MDLERFKTDNDYAYVRALPDGRLVGVMGMLFGKGRLWIGNAWAIDDAY